MAVEIKQYILPELKRAVCRAVSDVMLLHQNQPMGFIISGGSCLTLLSGVYEELAGRGAQDLQVTMFFGDERFDYENSNEKQLKEVYKSDLKNLQTLGITLESFPPRDNMEHTAIVYEEKMLSHITQIKKHKGVVFSLLGMGADGHIAGIFPHSEERIFYPLYLDTTKIVISHPYGVNPLNNRITLTYPGLLLSDQHIVYITGKSKEQMLKNALYDTPPLNENPALFFSQCKATSQIFTDLSL
jgi:6-phosphogluconolactonase/glucosamine-6-phosphate isomerase/deaminase